MYLSKVFWLISGLFSLTFFFQLVFSNNSESISIPLPCYCRLDPMGNKVDNDINDNKHSFFWGIEATVAAKENACLH